MMVSFANVSGIFGGKCGPLPDLVDFQVSKFSYKGNKDWPFGMSE